MRVDVRQIDARLTRVVRRRARGVKPSPALGASSSRAVGHRPTRTNRRRGRYPGSFLASISGSFWRASKGVADILSACTGGESAADM